MVGRWLKKYHAIGNPELEGSDEPEDPATTSFLATAQLEDSSTQGPSKVDSSRLNRSSFRVRTEHLHKFIDEFPKLPSHYCQSTTNKQYLQTDIGSISKFYKLYKSKCEEDDVTLAVGTSGIRGFTINPFVLWKQQTVNTASSTSKFAVHGVQHKKLGSRLITTAHRRRRFKTTYEGFGEHSVGINHAN